MRRAILEVALLGARRRRARLLGRPLRALLRGRVARPLDLPRPRARRARRRAAAARRALRRSPSPRSRSPSLARLPGVESRRRRRRRRHHDVRARRAARALARLSARRRGAAVRRHPRPDRRRPGRRRGPGRRARGGAAAAARPPARGRLRPRLGAGARLLGRRRVDAALLVLLAAAIVVAVQGLGNLLVVAVFVGPAATARNLSDRIGPMIAIAVRGRRARRRRRSLPLLLRRAPRAAPRSRWRSSPSTCSRCRSRGCARRAHGGSPMAEATIV